MSEERVQGIVDLRLEWKTRAAAEVLRLAAERFGPRMALSTGFGEAGCVLIDLTAQGGIRADVFTLDTGLLFPETYELWERLERRYGISIRGVRPSLNVEEQGRLFGDGLWERDPDRCCALRKLDPLRAALAGVDAWITAIRRDQTADRSRASVFELEERYGVVKIHPLLEWTAEEVRTYVRLHDVPVHPLHARGYPSIGCAPCTSPVLPGEDPRAGRWRGRGKTECGLHARLPEQESVS